MPIHPPELMPVYGTPSSPLLQESSDTDTLRAMKRKLRTVALQGGLVAMSCGLGGLGVVTGYFDPEGAVAVTSTDPVKILVVGALVVGAISGLVGTAIALLGSSMVGHWIAHTLEDERSSPS